MHVLTTARAGPLLLSPQVHGPEGARTSRRARMHVLTTAPFLPHRYTDPKELVPLLREALSTEPQPLSPIEQVPDDH